MSFGNKITTNHYSKPKKRLFGRSKEQSQVARPDKSDNLGESRPAVVHTSAPNSHPRENRILKSSNHEMEPEEDGAEGVITFKARLTNPNILASGLRGIANGKRDQHVQVEIIPEEAIRFLTTDPTKALQGCANISEKNFEEWQFGEEATDISFRINLAILLDCLTMLGNGTGNRTGLQLEFRAETGTLSLQLIENGALTECKIRTVFDEVEEDQALDFAGAFRAAASMNKAILLSEYLRDAFLELGEVQGVSIVTISATSDPAPLLRLSTEGEAGVCFIDFGREAFSLFDAPSPLTFHYRLNLLQRALKPLSEAEKTYIRMNSDGLLCFQHLIRQPDSQKTFVDFYVLACEEAGTAEAQLEQDDE